MFNYKTLPGTNGITLHSPEVLSPNQRLWGLDGNWELVESSPGRCCGFSRSSAPGEAVETGLSHPNTGLLGQGPHTVSGLSAKWPEHFGHRRWQSIVPPKPASQVFAVPSTGTGGGHALLSLGSLSSSDGTGPVCRLAVPHPW